MSRLLDIHSFVADKLQWQVQVIVDQNLSANARLVGCLIAHDLNVERGAAWRAQENMALALGVHKTTVRRGIAELAKAGYLAVRKSLGRGKSQHYVALIRDAAEAHDSIDRAIDARRAKITDIAERVAPALLDPSEKVAPALLNEPKKVAPALFDDVERGAPALQKGSSGATLTLEESITPPFPPSRRERAQGDDRTNRVRRNWGEPVSALPKFQNAAVRGIAVKRLTEEGARSWLDQNAWDPDAKAIVCQLGFTADRLSRDLGRDLRPLGVSVVCDKRRFDELMRAGRPEVGGMGVAA